MKKFKVGDVVESYYHKGLFVIIDASAKFYKAINPQRGYYFHYFKEYEILKANPYKEHEYRLSLTRNQI